MAELSPVIKPPADGDRAQAKSWLASESVVGFLLSAISGFVDTAGFILLAGLFTAHVTGNFVLAGSAIAGSRDAAVYSRLAMFPVFMLGVIIASTHANFLRARRRSVFRGMLIAEAAFLLAFMLSGIALHPDRQGDSDAWQVTVVGALGVLAMAIQNTLMREALASSLPTTVMTGNFTMFTMDLFALARLPNDPTNDERAKAKARLWRLAPVMSGFLVGCGLGAIGAAVTGFFGVALPIALTLALAYAAR